MTVLELINILEDFDDGLPVRIEGCDCDGYAVGAIVEEERGNNKYYVPKCVLITREGGYHYQA